MSLGSASTKYASIATSFQLILTCRRLVCFWCLVNWLTERFHASEPDTQAAKQPVPKHSSLNVRTVVFVRHQLGPSKHLFQFLCHGCYGSKSFRRRGCECDGPWQRLLDGAVGCCPCVGTDILSCWICTSTYSHRQSPLSHGRHCSTDRRNWNGNGSTCAALVHQ